MFFDSHAHLDRHHFKDDVLEVLARAREAGVGGIVTVGSGASPSIMEEAVSLARDHDDVWAAVGVHPHEADQASPESFQAIERLLADPRTVALGEIGLDHHYDLSSRSGQLAVFRKQVAMAAEADLPMVIHCRDAHAECLEVLASARLPSRVGVVHCFTGDLETARRYVALGFVISIPGVVTFPTAGPLIDAVRGLLSERLLIETDSPYLAPVPRRGRRNEPAFVRYTAEAVARIKGLSVEDVGRITDLNARRLFGLDVGDGVEARLVYSIRDSLYVNMTNRCTLRCTFCRKFSDWVVKGHNLRLPDDPPVEELLAALERTQIERYEEVVFCGYGEPLRRVDEVKTLAAWVKARGKKVRINTDGLASLVHGRDVAGELAGLVDTLSVSLNAPDAVTYARYCRSSYGEAAFDAVVAFLRRARDVVPDVVATAVALPDLDVEAVRRLAEQDLGVRFRLRPMDDMG
jgi:TatD DNase family protein